MKLRQCQDKVVGAFRDASKKLAASKGDASGSASATKSRRKIPQKRQLDTETLQSLDTKHSQSQSFDISSSVASHPSNAPIDSKSVITSTLPPEIQWIYAHDALSSKLAPNESISANESLDSAARISRSDWDHSTKLDRGTQSKTGQIIPSAVGDKTFLPTAKLPANLRGANRDLHGRYKSTLTSGPTLQNRFETSGSARSANETNINVLPDSIASRESLFVGGTEMHKGMSLASLERRQIGSSLGLPDQDNTSEVVEQHLDADPFVEAIHNTLGPLNPDDHATAEAQFAQLDSRSSSHGSSSRGSSTDLGYRK